MTVVEAKELLGTFDGSLREYAARKLVSRGVKLRKVRVMLLCACLLGASCRMPRTAVMDAGLEVACMKHSCVCLTTIGVVIVQVRRCS